MSTTSQKFKNKINLYRLDPNCHEILHFGSSLAQAVGGISPLAAWNTQKHHYKHLDEVNIYRKIA
jgi:hypothetical protein